MEVDTVINVEGDKLPFDVESDQGIIDVTKQEIGIDVQKSDDLDINVEV